MQKHQDLIIEIGTEELPPMFINQIVSTFREQLIKQFSLKNLTFYRATPFATPRRFAVLIEQLSIKQSEQLKIKKGPSITVAYDENGCPTKALLGFVNSLNIELNQLNIVTDEHKKSSWVEYQEKTPGELTIDLLPEIITASIKDLPGPKMSWGEGEVIFARPVHWVLALFGSKLVDCSLFGVRSNNLTYGHRFMVAKPIKINDPLEYQQKLQSMGQVVADFNQRKQLIISGIQQIETELNARCMLDENLLEQVTNMVEYPVVLCASFSEKFLQLPYECLILVMKYHQKSFALMDRNNKLLPKFIIISNIKTKDYNNIILGNQKVMHARLEDAMFLYTQDLKTPISAMLEKLKTVILQEKLGDLYKQSTIIQKIAIKICNLLQGNIEQQLATKQAGILCKFDLVSNLVLEFPELQGIMGGHYLKLQQFDEQTATAVTEHYWPKFAEDLLPVTLPGTCVALAYRLNLLCGMFLIGIIPTGDKDPFGLRRACLGIIRILTEKQLSLNFVELFEITIAIYQEEIYVKENVTIEDQLIEFTLERLKNWYITNINNLNINFLYAVFNQKNYNLYDLDLRLKALIEFSMVEGFDNLIAANKRIVNFLDKLEPTFLVNCNNQIVNIKLFKTEEEQLLYQGLTDLQEIIQPLLKAQNYSLVLRKLITLIPLIDNFFDKVMVVVPDEKLKNNRICLLLKLKILFSQLADLEKI